MTESWAINTFIIGCIILTIIPAAVCFYKDVLKGSEGEVSDL